MECVCLGGEWVGALIGIATGDTHTSGVILANDLSSCILGGAVRPERWLRGQVVPQRVVAWRAMAWVVGQPRGADRALPTGIVVRSKHCTIGSFATCLAPEASIDGPLLQSAALSCTLACVGHACRGQRQNPHKQESAYVGFALGGGLP